jgi:hypothetical protein
MRRERDAKQYGGLAPLRKIFCKGYCVGLTFNVWCIYSKHWEWRLRGFRFARVGTISHPKVHGESYDD